MEEELIRVYSESLNSLQGGEQALMSDMEDHLKRKATELNRLQVCFQNEIRQIQECEKKQNLYRRMVSSMLSTFGYFRKELLDIRGLVVEVVDWRDGCLSDLKQIPVMIQKCLQALKSKDDSKTLKAKLDLSESEFKRVETQYRQQIEKQSHTIIDLERTLRNNRPLMKSASKREMTFQRNSSQHLRSYNAELIHAVQVSPLLQKRNSNIKETSISPVKGSGQRVLNKEEVIQKIRKYQQSKNVSEHNNNIDKKQVQVKNQILKKVSVEIQSLPDLNINLSFSTPIVSGFDVLIIGGKEVYKGMWKRGLFDGRGKFHSDSWVYDGEFRNGVIDGFGTLNFKGCTFIGKFQNGLAQGEATLYCRDRSVSGFWKDSVLVKQH